MKPVWLKCKVGEGQFSDERSVEGETIDGEGFSLFAPIDLVENDRIQVFELQRDNSRVLVQLPVQTLENGTTITVDSSQLQEA